MKSLMRSTSLAAIAVAFVAFSGTANALTVTLASSVQSPNPYPGADSFPLTPPTSHTGVFGTSNINVPGNASNPFGNNPADFYYVLSQAGAGAGTATYDIPTGSDNFSFLWGSPDGYNSVSFCSGLDGLGSCTTFSPSTVSGSPLFSDGVGYALVDFVASGGTFESVVFADSGQAAFEWSNVTITPLPAALPLFAGGLGLLGFLGRRKRRANVSAFAA